MGLSSFRKRQSDGRGTGSTVGDLVVPPDAVHPVNPSFRDRRIVCDLCGHETFGIAVKLPSLKTPLPWYHACSARCSETLLSMLQKDKGWVMRSTITDMEREAVGEARSTLWESVVKTAGEENAQHLFANVDADGADFIIYSVWNALRASMQRQSAVDGIPVALSEQPSWAGPQIVTDLDDEIPF